MTSTDIYTILSSKPHNPHYLNRYWKFIQSFQHQNSIKSVTEQHHICPKSNDLFPEYKSIKIHSWNSVHLTKRQHFIAHYLLSKSYGGKQIYAFWAMCNTQSPKDERIRTYNISSKVYEQSKNIFLKEASKDRKGKATYVDSMGNKITCSTKDPRVLSGELISTSTGRKYKPRSEECKKAQSIISTDIRWKQHPTRKINLYFLDIKLTLTYTRDDYGFIPYLDQGWSMKCSPEYKRKIAIESNKNRTEESRKRAAESISKSKMGKPGIKWSTEDRKGARKPGKSNWIQLYYDTITGKFIKMDMLDTTQNHIKVFTLSGYKVWDREGNKATVNRLSPVPPGYYNFYPLEEYYVLNVNTKIITKKIAINRDRENEIIIRIPNGNRKKFYNINTGESIYLNDEFLKIYGLPTNYVNNCKLIAKV